MMDKSISNREKIKIRTAITETIRNNDILNKYIMCRLSGRLWGGGLGKDNKPTSNKINNLVDDIVEELTNDR